MNTIVTVAEMVVSIEAMIKKICVEDGIVYEEFITALGNALYTTKDKQ